MLEHLIHDLRYAIRTLAKRPILLATTTISIGLGVGVNVAVHGALRKILFEPGFTAGAPLDLFFLEPGLSYPNYVDVRTNDAFANLAAMQASTLTWRTGDVSATVSAHVVSDNFFEVMDLHAFRGRVFGTTNDARRLKDSNVAVISYGFWKHLGGDQTVLGRTLYLNGWPYVIGGVLPDGVYTMVGPLVAPSVYVPLGPRVNRGLDSRNAAQFDVVGRRRNGMTREQASAVLAAVAADLERRFPDANRGLSRTLSIAPFGGLIQRLPLQAGRIAFTLAGALYAVVVLVLLVACTNVAGLLLARTAERAPELSVRIALGATPGRIMQQILVESGVIAVLGCLAGATLWMVVTTALPKMPLVSNAGFDLIPVSASLVQWSLLAVLVALACGIAPALTANRLAPALGLQSSRTGPGLNRWDFRKSLVAGQVGLTFVFLAGACALLFSMARQLRTDPGFDIAHTVSIEMLLPTTSNRPPSLALRDAIADLPGVEAVSFGDLPIGLLAFSRVHKADGAGDGGLSVDVNRVGPRYLATLGIRLLQGRDLDDGDVRNRSAIPTPVIVGETLARRLFGSADVLGQSLVLGRDPESGREAQRLQVVGVSQDGAIQIFGGDRVPVLYMPALSPSLVVRVEGPADGAVRTIERAIATLEPGAAVTVAPMAARLSAVLLPVRMAIILLGVLGAVSLVLSMTGLYGSVSYVANRRRFEIGLRSALGASWWAIMRLVLRDAVMIVGVGSIAGGVLAVALLRAVWPLLAGNQISTSPLALVVVFVLITLVGIVAALRPALRSASVDPSVALRQE